MEDSNMKKTYINPTMAVIKIASKTQMLAGSVDGFNSGLNTTGGSGSGALSREFDFDDEDY